MPVDYAKKLAAQLMKDNAEAEVTVDVPGGGDFADRVIEELRNLGFRVVLHEVRPGRLTIYRDGKK